MPSTPRWEAARSGLTNDLNATNHANQVDQFLGTHNTGFSYWGNSVLNPIGGTGLEWLFYGNGYDFDQPFTLSGTSIGRIQVPIQPHGNAADLLVTLCSDNGSGLPNTTSGVIISTLVPAAVINQLCSSTGIANGGPLTLADFNQMRFIAGTGTKAWGGASGSSNGVASFATLVTSGNYSIFLGGFDTTASVPVALCASVQYTGAGTVAQPVQQPSLPQATFYGAAAATTNEVVYMGGQYGAVNNSTNVWVAGWNSNTGVISTWSKQAALPVGVGQAAGAAWNETVYISGGTTNASNTGSVANVFFANVSNGQLSTWQTGPLLPQPLYLHFMQVVGNWLVVTGGLTAADTVNSSTYYAPINSDGSLGGWLNGPALTTGIWTVAPGSGQAVANDAMVLGNGATNPAGSTFTNHWQTLTFTSHGPATMWSVVNGDISGSTYPVSAFSTGSSGEWDYISYNLGSSLYNNAKVHPVPMLPVPLYATGLTNGATYHIMLQQHQYPNTSDYFGIGSVNGSALPQNLLLRNRFTGTWSAFASGYTCPIQVFDASTVGKRIHTLGDYDPVTIVSSRYDTYLEDYRGMPVGYVEVTEKPNDPRNVNPTFTSGVSPWTATNATITQSSAQTHGGYPFSGLLTPNGTSAAVFASSELFPLDSTLPNDFYMAFGWFYSTSGTTNFSLSVSWYDNSQALISTSSTTQSLTAATWTLVINFFKSPVGAEFGQLVPTLGGTPASSNTLYMSDVAAVVAPENTGVVPSVVQFNYGSTTVPWPLTGVTQLV